MRLRLRFAKVGRVRFTSHRDVARLWERALRRAELPVRYSQGFSPRPRLSFGLALPTGAESDGEYLDVELDPEGARRWRGGLDPAVLPGVLTPLLPAGLDVTAAAAVDAAGPSLQELVTACEWVLHAERADGSRPDVDAFAAAVDAVLAADEVVVTRQRKGRDQTEDVRPAIRDLTVEDATDRAVVVRSEVAAQPRALRPRELLAALGAGFDTELVAVQLRRTHQWIERDGARREPLPPSAGAEHAPHAEQRAS